MEVIKTEKPETEKKKRVCRMAGIDPGLKNLALCVIDVYNAPKRLELVEWDIQSIVNRGRLVKSISTQEVCNSVCEWLDSRKDFFQTVDRFFVETQMTSKMKQVQSIIFAKLHPKVTFVSANKVKAFFKINLGNYLLNKKAAVRMAQDIILEQVGNEIALQNDARIVDEETLRKKTNTKYVEEVMNRILDNMPCSCMTTQPPPSDVPDSIFEPCEDRDEFRKAQRTASMVKLKETWEDNWNLVDLVLHMDHNMADAFIIVYYGYKVFAKFR